MQWCNKHIVQLSQQPLLLTGADKGGQDTLARGNWPLQGPPPGSAAVERGGVLPADRFPHAICAWLGHQAQADAAASGAEVSLWQGCCLLLPSCL